MLRKEDARAVAERVARTSYGRLVAFLAFRTRDVASAEDALSEAFAAALTTWPVQGCPDNPEAWLLTTARRKVIDSARHRVRGEDVARALGILMEGASSEAAEIPDQRLALLFVCAHPAIEEGIRAPLMLQVILGLDAKSIASAFLASPSAMGKRLVRAKEKIRKAGIPFEIPTADAWPSRVHSVLEAIYVTFSEGWSDPGGVDLARRGLTGEALFLARMVVDLLPNSAEALGLLALMLHAEARLPARRDATGAYVPLPKQNDRRWNTDLMMEAEGLIRRAAELNDIGRYQLEAALQSAHTFRRKTGHSNWSEVVHLYDALMAVAPSPVVAMNRALAVAEVNGPDAGLALLPDPANDSRLLEYQPYWAARAELLRRRGSVDLARDAYDVAIGLERDEAVRRFLQRRRDGLSTIDS
ncbi:MAG: DUF6596 domain-containing protein [Vicinamibacteria bacterium]